jgi:hypothetical protein
MTVWADAGLPHIQTRQPDRRDGNVNVEQRTHRGLLLPLASRDRPQRPGSPPRPIMTQSDAPSHRNAAQNRMPIVSGM